MLCTFIDDFRCCLVLFSYCSLDFDLGVAESDCDCLFEFVCLVSSVVFVCCLCMPV